MEAYTPAQKIENIRQSLHDFPSFAKKEMSQDGNAFLSDCVYADNKKCSCQIIGNGTLQNPLEISFCDKHKK